MTATGGSGSFLDHGDKLGASGSMVSAFFNGSQVWNGVI